MKTIKIWNDSPSERQLDEIASLLNEGQVMIWPTDTLYGIACDALNVKAIDRICRLKGLNPEKAHLSIVASDIAQAAEYAKFDNKVFRLLKVNTPGPFTFLCRAASSLPRAFKGRKTVGVRIPDCLTARSIAERLGRPILTTSIEYDDEDFAIDAGLIAEKYSDRVDFFIEGEEGKTTPSTTVDCTTDDFTIVREGLGELEL